MESSRLSAYLSAANLALEEENEYLKVSVHCL